MARSIAGFILALLFSCSNATAQISDGSSPFTYFGSLEFSAEAFEDFSDYGGINFREGYQVFGSNICQAIDNIPGYFFWFISDDDMQDLVSGLNSKAEERCKSMQYFKIVYTHDSGICILARHCTFTPFEIDPSRDGIKKFCEEVSPMIEVDINDDGCGSGKFWGDIPGCSCNTLEWCTGRIIPDAITKSSSISISIQRDKIIDLNMLPEGLLEILDAFGVSLNDLNVINQFLNWPIVYPTNDKQSALNQVYTFVKSVIIDIRNQREPKEFSVQDFLED